MNTHWALLAPRPMADEIMINDINFPHQRSCWAASLSRTSVHSNWPSSGGVVLLLAAPDSTCNHFHEQVNRACLD